MVATYGAGSGECPAPLALVTSHRPHVHQTKGLLVCQRHYAAVRAQQTIVAEVEEMIVVMTTQSASNLAQPTKYR
jgi:hypothetical protein